MWNTEYRKWNKKHGIRSTEYGILNVEFAIKNKYSFTNSCFSHKFVR